MVTSTDKSTVNPTDLWLEELHSIITSLLFWLNMVGRKGEWAWRVWQCHDYVLVESDHSAVIVDP